MAAPNSFKNSMKQNPFQSGSFMPAAGGLGNISDNIREFVNDHKIESLAILIAGGFLFFTYLLVSGRMDRVHELDAAIAVLREKDAPSQEYRSAQKNTEQLLKEVPGVIPESRFVVILTQLADKRSIRISSFNPPKSYRESFYIASEVEISFSAPSFRDGMLFLKDIETLPFSMRIMSLVIRPVSENFGGGAMGADVLSSAQSIEMNAVLSSVSLVENDKKTAEKK